MTGRSTTGRPTPRARAAAVAAVLALAAAALTACSSSSAGSSDALRLGYFPNLTHATALVGVKQGFFQKALGDARLQTSTFNAGPAVIEALNAGSIDAAYVGPNPAVNGYVKSNGESLRIISGATSGGAALVVKPEITSAQQLKGKTLNTPQLGNTQDVALRSWLEQQGYDIPVSGKGDVDVQSAENSTTLQLFQDGKIDGAWVPEPWVSRMVAEGGKVLVDEATLWPKGEFVTTQLIVSQKYLAAHPEQVKALLQGHLDTNAWIAANESQAKQVANDELKALSGKALTPDVLDRAWSKITVTNDPIASSLLESAKHGTDVGVTKATADQLKGIYDLTLLNGLLKAENEPAVSDQGYGAAA